MSNGVALDFVDFEGKTYRISTINREASSMLAYGNVYAETLVWLNHEIVGQAESSENSRYAHDRMIEKIKTYGPGDDNEDDD